MIPKYPAIAQIRELYAHSTTYEYLKLQESDNTDVRLFVLVIVNFD